MVRTFDWLPTSSTDRLVILAGSLGFTLAAWYLFFAPVTLSYDQTAAPVATVKMEGKIRRRHARVLQWEDLSREAPVFLRDILYVPEGATAEVTLHDGKKIVLAPESLVQFDDITIHEIEISLWDKVQKVAQAKPKVFRLMPLPKPPKAGALPDTFGLSMLQQDLGQRLEAIRKVEFKALEVKKVAMPPRFSLKNLPDYDVLLASPLNGSKIALNGERWMKMAWSPVPLINITYELLMSRDPNFKQTIPHQTQSTSVNVQFQDAGKYYWRVRVRRANETVTSAVSEFEMVVPRGVAGKKPGQPIAPSSH